MFDLSVKYNELTAEQFIELWETVWGDGPTHEQTELAMNIPYSEYLYGMGIVLLLWQE